MISILGVVAIVVIAIQVHKTASSTGRNAAACTGAAVAAGLAIQFVFPFIIGLLIAIYLLGTGTPQQQLREQLQHGLFGLMGVIDVVAVVLSIVGMFFVARHVSKVKDDNVHAPPPPPAFGAGVS